MPPDPALIRETAGWLRKANRDLAAAEHDLRADPPLLDDVAFHAQQTAEKAMKAFLTWHGQPFRKTHNLIELGEQVAHLDASLEPLLRRAAPLSEYAWKFRYPGDVEQPTAEEARSAIGTARAVFDAVAALLPDASDSTPAR